MQNNTIVIASKEIKYSITQKKGLKYLRISFVSHEELKIISPLRISELKINKILKEKENWILKNLNNFENGLKINNDKPFSVIKANAQLLIREMVDYYAFKYGVEYKNIYIKKYKSRWGCCSSKKDLSFNYKLALLPQEIIKYVVVHEICHLIEFNHSPRFWNLVRLEVNNYKEIRSQLKYVKFE